MLLAAVFSSVFCAASQIITEVETEEISKLSVAIEASEAEAVITLVSALDFVSTSAQVVAVALLRRDPDRALTTFSAALAASSLAFSVLAFCRSFAEETGEVIQAARAGTVLSSATLHNLNAAEHAFFCVVIFVVGSLIPLQVLSLPDISLSILPFRHSQALSEHSLTASEKSLVKVMQESTRVLLSGVKVWLPQLVL